VVRLAEIGVAHGSDALLPCPLPLLLPQYSFKYKNEDVLFASLSLPVSFNCVRHSAISRPAFYFCFLFDLFLLYLFFLRLDFRIGRKSKSKQPASHQSINRKDTNLGMARLHRQIPSSVRQTVGQYS
jgi:hypothetical protein